MKKVLTIAILFVMVAMLATSVVNAATTSELVDKIYSMGEKYGLTSADKVRLERFLSDNPVSEEEADQLIAKAEAAVKVMEDAGVTSVSELTTAQKNQLKSIANEAADIVGVTLVFSSSKVEIYKDGKLVETVTANDDKLAYTGNSINAVLVVSSVAIIALAAVIVAKKRLANAR